jgi:hypothetical protein
MSAGGAYHDLHGRSANGRALEARGLASADRLALRVELDSEAISAIVELVMARLAERLEAPAEDGWIDAKAAASYLGVSLDGLHRMTARRGRDGIPAGRDKPNGKLWFKRSELDEWRRDNGR